MSDLAPATMEDYLRVQGQRRVVWHSTIRDVSTGHRKQTHSTIHILVLDRAQQTHHTARYPHTAQRLAGT
eukprot:3941986-Rhodomonas_salina.2